MLPVTLQLDQKRNVIVLHSTLKVHIFNIVEIMKKIHIVQSTVLIKKISNYTLTMIRYHDNCIMVYLI